MTTQTKTPSLEEFLTVTAGSKEMGLIIAKDASESASYRAHRRRYYKS
jgi:hypothetical protein